MTGSGNLTINNAFNWTGGTLGGTGVVTVQGATTITGGVDEFVSGSVVLAGGGSWSGCSNYIHLTAGTGASLTVGSGGTFADSGSNH